MSTQSKNIKHVNIKVFHVLGHAIVQYGNSLTTLLCKKNTDTKTIVFLVDILKH